MAFLVLGGVFVRRSSRHPQPVLDLTLFRSRSFSVANAAALLYSMGFFAMLLGNILFLTSVWHYSILRAGLAVTPGPLVVAVVAGPAGKLAGRYGFRRVLLTGFVVFTAGLAWYATRVGTRARLPRDLAAGHPGGGTRDRAHLPGAERRCRVQPPSPSGSPWAAPSTRRPARWAERSGWRCSWSILGYPDRRRRRAGPLPPPVVVRRRHGRLVRSGVLAARSARLGPGGGGRACGCRRSTGAVPRRNGGRAGVTP